MYWNHIEDGWKAKWFPFITAWHGFWGCFLCCLREPNWDLLSKYLLPLYIRHSGADPGGGGWGSWPPPCSRPPIIFFSTNFLSICGLRHMGNVQGGVLVNVQEWVYFSIFRRPHDVTRTMSKGGGCLWMSWPPPPPFGKSCIRAWH